MLRLTKEELNKICSKHEWYNTNLFPSSDTIHSHSSLFSTGRKKLLLHLDRSAETHKHSSGLLQLRPNYWYVSSYTMEWQVDIWGRKEKRVNCISLNVQWHNWYRDVEKGSERKLHPRSIPSICFRSFRTQKVIFVVVSVLHTWRFSKHSP